MESKSIEIRSSSDEWNNLLKWVRLKSESYKSKGINPWQRPKLSKEEIEKRLIYSSLGYGMY